MFESITKLFTEGLQLSVTPAEASIFVLALLFMIMLWREHKNSKLDWTDMITSKGTNKVSLTKLLQLIGGVTGTWIMVVGTLKASLTVDWFITYLAYVGCIEGWSKYVSARYRGSGNDAAPVTTTHRKPVSAKVPEEFED